MTSHLPPPTSHLPPPTSIRGHPKDWSKVSSSSYTASDGSIFEVHAYRNAITGQVVEPKTIQPVTFPGGEAVSMRISMNPHEAAARNQLVQVVQAMLKNQKSFFEGAKVVLELRSQIGGVLESDPDFNAFVVIYSETNHLAYEAQRHLWSPDALAKLEAEYEQTELWATSFAPKACENLLTRFDGGNVT